MLYLEVLLPLDLSEVYHYQYEDDLFNDSESVSLVGKRVTVSFGSKRFYTGVVRRQSSSIPQELSSKKLKSIETILDEEPIFHEEDFIFWEWLAEYYCASLGQVMNEVMPKGLLPESKTLIFLNEDFQSSQTLDETQLRFLSLLQSEGSKGSTLTKIRSQLGRGTLTAFDRLLSANAIYTEEKIKSRYKAKTQTFIQLHPSLHSEEALQTCLTTKLKRAKKQQCLLEEFIAKTSNPEQELNINYPQLELERDKLIQKDSSLVSLLRTMVKNDIFISVEKDVSRLATEEKKTIDSDYLKSLKHYKEQALWQGTNYLYTKSTAIKEDYLIAKILQELERGGQVLLLTPNNHQDQFNGSFYNKLEKALQHPIYYYHNLISEEKRCELFLKLKSITEPALFVGGRNAIVLPIPHLSLIIIEQEHEYLYKQQFARPLYHSRNVALWLANKKKIPTILASETPSVESLFNIFRKKYHLLNTEETPQLSDSNKLKIQSLDLKLLREQGRLHYGKIISQPLYEAIKQTISKGQRVLLLKNRKGYAPFIICNQCSEHIRCKHCDISLNYHSATRQLICHYCGYHQTFPSACPSCQTQTVELYGKPRPALSLVGYGTQRVEEELRELFPREAIIRIDSDSLQSNKRQQEVAEALADEKSKLIVATQLIKSQALWQSNQVPIGLIAVVQLDELLAYPDFRTEERAYQLLYQLILRYNEQLQETKDDSQGELILQTNAPEQEFIQKLRAFDYKSFIHLQLREREMLYFPPFCRLTYIIFKGFDEQLVVRIAEAFYQLLAPHYQERNRISPVQAPSVARIDNQYLRQIVCRRPFQEGYKSEREVFAQVLIKLRHTLPESNKVRIYFDVDPL